MLIKPNENTGKDMDAIITFRNEKYHLEVYNIMAEDIKNLKEDLKYYKNFSKAVLTNLRHQRKENRELERRLKEAS